MSAIHEGRERGGIAFQNLQPVGLEAKIPDDLFASADALARRLGVSRSALIAAALAEYVAKNRSAKISERLDAVYAAEEGRVDRSLSRAQRQVLERSEW